MTARDSIHRHRSGLPYAVALVALASLGACTSSGEAQTPTASSGSTSAVTTTAAPPTTTTAPPSPKPSVDPVIAKIPAAARPETMEGAAAYSQFYFAKLNEAFKTGDTSLLNSLSSSECKTCSALSNGAAEVAKAGHHYGGDLTKVNYATATEFSSTTRQVLIDLNQEAVPVLDSTNREVEKTRSAKLAFVATLKFEKRWSIVRLQRASS